MRMCSRSAYKPTAALSIARDLADAITIGEGDIVITSPEVKYIEWLLKFAKRNTEYIV